MCLLPVDENPAANNAIPKTGNHTTCNQRERRIQEGDNSAVAPVVLTVSIDVPEPPATVLGLNAQAGCAIVAGAPLRVMLLHESVTALLKPPAPATVMVDVDDPPGETEEGDSTAPEIENPGITNDKEVLSGCEPDAVPVTLIGYVPAGVDAEVPKVSLEVPEAPPTDGGLKLQFAPLGSQEQANPTNPLNPQVAATVTVELAEPPAVTVGGERAEADMVKPACEMFRKVVTVASRFAAKSGLPSRLKSAASKKLVNATGDGN
jgi:hypothetical protein